MRRGVLAVAADRASGDADPRAVDEHVQRAQARRGVDGCDRLSLVADIGPGEEAADLAGHRLSPLLVEVEDDHVRAALRQQPCRGRAEPGRAAGDERRCAIEFHLDDLPRL